eukprot:6371843-Ditylum_brightwellii.AAC.1
MVDVVEHSSECVAVITRLEFVLVNALVDCEAVSWEGEVMADSEFRDGVALVINRCLMLNAKGVYFGMLDFGEDCDR